MKNQHIPLWDRLIGALVGKTLVYLGRRAYSRGDKHLYLHCVAALRYGNSVHRDRICPVVRRKP